MSHLTHELRARRITNRPTCSAKLSFNRPSSDPALRCQSSGSSSSDDITTVPSTSVGVSDVKSITSSWSTRGGVSATTMTSAVLSVISLTYGYESSCLENCQVRHIIRRILAARLLCEIDTHTGTF